MQQNYSIIVVDDTESARLILETTLKNDYTIISFESAEACLEGLANQTPNLFLLDVDLPGTDGFELCRRIHTQARFAETPVIFISGLDDLDSRLEGYDAGGIDFVVKPYKMAELRQKVQVALSMTSAKQSLLDKVQESDNLTSLILSNLDEYAVLITFLRSLNDCVSYRDVIAGAHSMLRAYNLHGVVQVRMPGIELAISENGENHPMEVAVLKHVQAMDRIFNFGSRSAYNFARLTIMVNDMPLKDPELCGRLRDHLAIAAETADSKLSALQASAENTRSRNELTQIISALDEAVKTYSAKYETARYSGTIATQAMLDEMASAYNYLGMSDEQEENIQNILRTKAFNLADIYDFGDETQTTLNDLAQKLAAILVETGQLPESQSIISSDQSVADRKTVAIELF